jgi:hypothetical protein
LGRFDFFVFGTVEELNQGIYFLRQYLVFGEEVESLGCQGDFHLIGLGGIGPGEGAHLKAFFKIQIPVRS